MAGLMAVRSPSARNTSRSSLHGDELREKQRDTLHCVSHPVRCVCVCVRCMCVRCMCVCVCVRCVCVCMCVSHPVM